MAVLNGNEVTNVIVCQDDEPETATLVTYTDANPAYIGGDYVDGFFYPIKPYPSWIRDNGTWQPPVKYPDDGEAYAWNEDAQEWQAVTN